VAVMPYCDLRDTGFQSHRGQLVTVVFVKQPWIRAIRSLAAVPRRLSLPPTEGR